MTYRSKVVSKGRKPRKAPKTAFKPGEPKKGGRALGTVNKITRDLKNGIIDAAVQLGRDGKGKDGLIGYLMYLGWEEPKSFASLLGRLIPLHIIGGVDLNQKTMTREEVAKALMEKGIPFQPLFAIPNTALAGTSADPVRVPGDDARVVDATVNDAAKAIPQDLVGEPASRVTSMLRPPSRFSGMAPPREEASGKPPHPHDAG